MEKLKRPTQKELDAMDHAQRDALIFKLFDIIEQLDMRVTELENQLKKNSSNSNKPPSADGLRKGAAQPRVRGQNLSCGQKGHVGKTLKMTDAPDVVETLWPQTSVCSCGLALNLLSATLKQRRQQVEIPKPQAIVTEYRQVAIVCDCGLAHFGQFPATVTPNISYGPRLKTYATGLVNGHFVSLARVGEIIGEQYGVKPSSGSIQKWNEQLGQCLQSDYDSIACNIAQSSVAHFDESGMRVEGGLHWLHVAASENQVHYSHHAKRGQDGMEAGGILAGFQGIAVHDHWQPYFHDQTCQHALCNAHHLRELRYFEQTLSEDWPQAMRQLLIETNKAVSQAKANGKAHLSSDDLNDLQQRYDLHVEAGLKAHPIKPKDPKKRGRTQQSPETNWLIRLKNFKVEVLRFSQNFNVPFTNNQAERLVRPVKVKRKVTGGFRAAFGSDAFCIIRSIWETCKLNHQNPFEKLRLAFIG